MGSQAVLLRRSAICCLQTISSDSVLKECPNVLQRHGTSKLQRGTVQQARAYTSSGVVMSSKGSRRITAAASASAKFLVPVLGTHHGWLLQHSGRWQAHEGRREHDRPVAGQHPRYGCRVQIRLLWQSHRRMQELLGCRHAGGLLDKTFPQMGEMPDAKTLPTDPVRRRLIDQLREGGTSGNAYRTPLERPAHLLHRRTPAHRSWPGWG